MTNSTLVRFSEEERSLLRDPENSKHFRREVEGELHVCVPEYFSRDPQSLTRGRGTQSFGGQFNIRGSELQKTFASLLAEGAKKNLASHPELIERCACHNFYLPRLVSLNKLSH
jgi:hypothetical protein